MNVSGFGSRRPGTAGVLFWSLLLSGFAARLPAQTTASVFGAVTDESGSVIQGARIQAINVRTNEVRHTVTNDLGYYSLPELPVGEYSVRAELEGFKTAVRDGISLSLNRNAKVDLILSVGALAEKVTVSGDAPLIETSTNEMGGLVDQRRVNELPINGRNTLSLINLVPGAQRLETGNAQGFVENKANVNGQRMEDSNWLLDGGDNTSPLRNYGNDVPNPDAIQEFRVITNNYGAEYGRSAGAVVNVVTKSGSNEFHGSAFEFLRNRALNARNFFSTNTLPLVQNQFGGTVGGPVKKNRTFFFGTFQSNRRRMADFRNSALVPTQAERNGDFSRSVDRSGKLVVIRDPLNNQPFSGNVIPAGRLSKVAQNYLNLAIPLPNYFANSPNGLYQTAGTGSDNNQWMAKVDHQFSDRHKLSGAYFWSDTVEHQRFLKEIDFARRDMKTRQHNLNVHEYWTISPTKLNHFRATYARSAGDRLVLPNDVTMTDLGSNFSPLPEGPLMPPAVQVSGYFDATSVNGGPKTANNYNLADTFSWMRGRHDLKFGTEGFLRRLFDVSTNPRQGGTWTLDGTVTGNALGDLMLGQVKTVEVGPQSYKSMNSWSWYWFAQDKVRLTRKLALTLGLRYELDTWPVTPSDALVAWRPGQKSSCVPQAPAGVLFPCDDGIPRAGVANDRNNFAPRFGLAYDLFGDGRTVIRTGYGISYAFSYLNALQDPMTSTPYSYTNTARSTTFETPYATLPGGNPFPLLFDPAHLKFDAGANYGFQSQDMRTGYVQQYNFSLQRQFGGNWSAEAAYVGNIGRKLMDRTDFNDPLRTAGATAANINQRRPYWPVFQQIYIRSGFVDSSYNALQTRLEKRFNAGLTLLASYTWGKWLDDSSWYDGTSSFADQRNIRLDRGLGEQNQAHVATVSWVWQPQYFAHSGGIRRVLLDGWAVNGIASFYGGQPLKLRTDKDNDFDGVTADRPDVAGDWWLSPNRSRAEVVQAWFRPQAFVANRAGQVGNLGRSVLIGPGFKGVDLGIVKTFRIREGHKLQFRAEAFNTFNWVNLGDPEVRLSRATFGVISSTTVTTSSATSNRDARIFQLGLRYEF